MRKTIGIITILIIMLIGLTGCVSVNYEVEVHKDGSGEISYVYAISKESLESINITADDFVASMKKQAEDNGYETEHYEDEKMEGFKSSKHVDNLKEEFSLQEAFGKAYVQDDEGNEIKVENSFINTAISQNAKIDLTSMEDMDSTIQMTYTVKLPIKVTNSNATEVSNNKKVLTWKLVGGEINNIEFTARQVNAGPIICLIILLIAIVAIVYFAIPFKKKEVTKE